MINSINKIYGIGKYDQYDGVVPLTKNQVFFGFNGSGKSTLSDIFYSLSDEEHSKKLLERKTLQRDDGTISNDPEIILGTDTNDLIFRDGSWNSRQNIFVFNDQYIDDYVTLRGNHDIDKEQLILGKEGNRLNRQKLTYENDFKVCLQNINEVISNNKEICNNLGVGKNKISINNWNKRITNIAKISLYTESQKKVVEKNLEGQKVYNKQLQRLNSWLENLVKHARFLEKNAFATSKGIVELFKNAGISDMQKLPESHAEKGKFAELFKEFNTYLEAAKIQGFRWDKNEYQFTDEATGEVQTITVDFNEDT